MLLTLIMALGLVTAEGQDEEYLQIYKIVEQADSLSQGGQTNSAKVKYKQAQTALLDFKKSHPSWNAKLVVFRLNYLAERITTLSRTNSASASVTGKAEADHALVKLLDAGAEPRKVLRLHVQPGDQQNLNMTVKISMDMGIGDMPAQAIKMPAMQMVMDVTVKTVSPEGDIAYETIIGEATVAAEPGSLPQLVEGMKTAFSGLKGLSGTGRMSNRGVNKGTEMKIPPGADPQTRQSIEQMKEAFANAAAPLPEEAVGPGARWEVKLPIKSQGMTIDQTTTYELVSIEGERLDLKITLVQNAASQKVENPAMPGLKIDVIKMTGNGTGKVTSELAKLLPSMATVDAHTDTSMAMNAGGQKQTMTMKMDANIFLESK